jgi:hypothetical protein
MFKFGEAFVQKVSATEKLTVKPQTPGPVVMNPNSEVDANVVQLLLESSCCRMQETGHPCQVIVFDTPIGLIIKGVAIVAAL